MPKHHQFKPSDPCICGSGKSIESCHLDPLDHKFRILLPPLDPPLPRSGFSNKNCYLRGTNDCSEKISSEHYISRSVLLQLGEIIRVSGAHWQKEGETLDTTIGNLAANILCKRHNEALSPLDAEAGKFFQALIAIHTDLNHRSLSRKPKFYLVCGDAIELWMLKLACGLFHSIGSANKIRISEHRTIDYQKVQRALFSRQWDNRGGLYVNAAPGGLIKIAPSVGIAPLSDEQTKRIAGAVAVLAGLRLELIFDDEDTNLGEWTALAKRPSELLWTREQRRRAIILTWPVGTPPRSIRMQRWLSVRA